LERLSIIISKASTIWLRNSSGPISFPTKQKKVGGLAVIAIHCLKPMTLRPILSDSLPLSTFEDAYSIFKYTCLYLFYSLKESVLDINLGFY